MDVYFGCQNAGRSFSRAGVEGIAALKPNVLIKITNNTETEEEIHLKILRIVSSRGDLCHLIGAMLAWPA